MSVTAYFVDGPLMGDKFTFHHFELNPTVGYIEPNMILDSNGEYRKPPLASPGCEAEYFALWEIGNDGKKFSYSIVPYAESIYSICKNAAETKP